MKLIDHPYINIPYAEGTILDIKDNFDPINERYIINEIFWNPIIFN